MTHVTCRLTAKNRDQLRNPTLGNQVWATFSHYLFLLPWLAKFWLHWIAYNVLFRSWSLAHAELIEWSVKATYVLFRVFNPKTRLLRTSGCSTRFLEDCTRNIQYLTQSRSSRLAALTRRRSSDLCRAVFDGGLGVEPPRKFLTPCCY